MKRCCFLVLLLLVLGLGMESLADEADALRLSSSIAARHLPFGTILDPVIGEDGEISGYTRCGDSALWTGHYLAAESFRYSVTQSPEAFDAVRAAIRGIRSLVDVTGRDLLARCVVPSDSPFAEGIIAEEERHGVYEGVWEERAYYWIGNTSRDQYSGVLFGLGVAYENVEDGETREEVRRLVTRLLNRLLRDNWTVVLPDGTWSTVFWQRPDQMLSFLQIGQHINPDRFRRTYKSYRFWYASSAYVPLAAEAADTHNSYFKFNLAAINLYHLLRWEDSRYYRWWYERAYEIWREAVDSHGNAHFHLIDRAVRGANDGRDAETRSLLEAWLERPGTDEWLDWRGVYPSCGQEDRACDPLPVADRVRTDFLWQRSPFLLYGGGSGVIEGGGIDYVLPYWMARKLGVLNIGE